MPLAPKFRQYRSVPYSNPVIKKFIFQNVSIVLPVVVGVSFLSYWIFTPSPPVLAKTFARRADGYDDYVDDQTKQHNALFRKHRDKLDKEKFNLENDMEVASFSTTGNYVRNK